MLHYSSYDIVASEIPDELSLGISITGCPIHCIDCHSPHLWIEQGIELNPIELIRLVEEQKYVSCILFLGGDWDVALLSCLDKLHRVYKHQYKYALYSGYPFTLVHFKKYLKYLDYLKVGPYIKHYGGLDSWTTNQRLYTINKGKLNKDITFKFWRTNEPKS